MTRLAFAALLALSVATPALAQSRNEVRTQEVEFNRNALNDKSGAEARELVRRISNAADNVCGERMGPRPLDEIRATRGCATEATEQGVHDVEHPNVTAEYYGVRPEIVIDDNPGSSGK